jgi:serine/threonine protein kinase
VKIIFWEKCGDKVVKDPKLSGFETFIEIFNNYFQITVNTVDSELYDSTPERRNDRLYEKFNEIELIDSSSFGLVYKALNRNDSEIYAIKKIAFSNCELDKINREINIMKKLRSLYVVEYKSYWIENNCYLNHEFNKEHKCSIKYGNEY